MPVKKHLLDYTLKIRIPVITFVIITTFALTYFISRPERVGAGYHPEQPIKFSHKLHAGTMDIDCQYCHSSVDKSRHASIPPVSTCINCHSVARRDKEEIIKLYKYYDNNKPLRWKRVHKVPDYVYFNHSAHVNKGIDCENCHGDVKRMDAAVQIESFTMGDCLSCHRSPHDNIKEMNKSIKTGPEHCNTCHR